jgi:hypothetical protein
MTNFVSPTTTTTSALVAATATPVAGHSTSSIDPINIMTVESQKTACLRLRRHLVEPPSSPKALREHPHLPSWLRVQLSLTHHAPLTRNRINSIFGRIIPSPRCRRGDRVRCISAELEAPAPAPTAALFSTSATRRGDRGGVRSGSIREQTKQLH